MKASESDPRLKSLISAFAAFRAQSRPHTRIPEQLRNGTLELIASGLRPSLVARALKVSPSQLMGWRQRVASPGLTKTEPRILEVIPMAAAPVHPNGLRVTYEAGRLLLELTF